jgi:8-oxo-dGTP diphosphatase
MENLPEIHAVTSFLESENKILLLLRSERVSTYRGKWAGISGQLDNGRTADEQALIEIEEETGLSREDVKLIKKGNPLIFNDENLSVRKVIYPYLFHVENRNKITIDWEHQRFKWIKPEDIDQYDSMPKLKETLARVLP